MLIDFEPGDYVKNPENIDWGIGQVQSIIGNKVTDNFENSGKKVINISNIFFIKLASLKKIANKKQKPHFQHPYVIHSNNHYDSYY